MENNSCLMLNCTLYLPVSLSSIFDKEDLKDTGIENESHVTLLYAAGKEIPKDNLLGDIETILGDSDFSFDNFMEFIKNEETGKTDRVMNCFELGSFENDSDYIVLKMKQECKIYFTLGLINKGLRAKYGVSSEYSYTPHLSLAELKPGTTSKYLNNPKLNLILGDSFVSFEDLVISYGPSNTPVDRERYNLTTFNVVDYFFHTERNRKENMELD